MTVCFKNSSYAIGSAWFAEMLHYFGFTIQLALLRVFNLNVQNLAFDTSTITTNASMIFYEELHNSKTVWPYQTTDHCV